MTNRSVEQPIALGLLGEVGDNAVDIADRPKFVSGQPEALRVQRVHHDLRPYRKKRLRRAESNSLAGRSDKHSGAGET
ncbi:MAG: hypothetical protein WA688_05305 [Thermoplasmata archaeon]